MRIALASLLLMSCAKYDGPYYNFDAGHGTYLYCRDWKMGSYISPYDGLHTYYYCDIWVKSAPQ